MRRVQGVRMIPSLMILCAGGCVAERTEGPQSVPSAGQEVGAAAAKTVQADSGADHCSPGVLRSSGSSSTGSSFTGGAPPDAASERSCGGGGQCIQGPFCTPGGCVGANEWTCVYGGTAPCQAVNGRLICGGATAEAGATDQ
jgi:hypothetical protein